MHAICQSADLKGRRRPRCRLDNIKPLSLTETMQRRINGNVIVNYECERKWEMNTNRKREETVTV